MNRFLFLVCFVSITSSVHKESTLETILMNGSKDFQNVLHSEDFGVQIIYGEIKDDSLIHHYYGDTGAYFYPASTIKMLNAFASVKWLQEKGLSINSSVFLDSGSYHSRTLAFDSLFSDSIKMVNLLKKIFVYSDNQASNILFNLLGKDYINQLYKEIGIESRIVHQLGENAYSFSPNSNNWTADAVIYDEKQRIRLTSTQQGFISSLRPKNQIKGRGYINENNELVNEGFDFSKKNYVPLKSLLGSLERVVYPELFDLSYQINIQDKLRKQLLEIMELKPRDLPYPIDTLADNYVKFLMVGDQESSAYPSSLKILNKVGWAYGYLTDVAFIHDIENDVNFFLASTIHVNRNQIYNDGIYEYEEVGLPFLGELGRLIYAYELSKKPTYK